MLETPSSVLPLSINGRYEIQEAPIGQGGMGVVYKAYDTVTRRHVALKTMPGSGDGNAIEMFEREWTVLARISHPNIVDILDTGEFYQDGQRRPYFVMPLLRGCTLDQLIRQSSERLTVEGVVDIISQVCRGLQAAHDQKLVHRDLKPSNIFVMEDDAIKIIDFGIAHLTDTRSVTGMKGTLQYMAPEQLEMKEPTPLSDIFSLGVVCYEAFTGNRPFARKTENEVVDAIRLYVPPAASEVNSAVNQMVSRTVHKAMAKQSWHRFSNAREFGDTLRRALRNESIERFDRSKIQPRIDRVKKAQSEGDYQFAAEILTELESEGHIDADMSALRIQIDQTIRQRAIRQLLESARTRIEEDELPLALQKIQSVLEIDPENADALALKEQVERQRSARQIENWFRLVHQHIENQDYSQARQGIGEILKIDSAETRARELLAAIDRSEAELLAAQAEKQTLYEAALASYHRGEISTALGKLERLLEMDRSGPRSNPERNAQYQSLYNQVRSEHDAVRNAYGEARRHLVEKNFARTLEICEEHLSRHPGDPLFQALKLETTEAQRQQESADVAEINRRAEAEPDLNKKFSILSGAVEKHPNEQFKASLNLVRDRRDLINSIVARARQYEERQQLNDAAGQWDILKNIYPKYPGLDFELERLARRREEQARIDTKALWVQQVDRHLAIGDYLRAQDVLKQANLEFPDDAELQELGAMVQRNMARSAEAATLLNIGGSLIAQGKHSEGLDALREAEHLDERNPSVRAALMSAVLKRARDLMLEDWRAAEPLVQEAMELDDADPVVKGLSTLIDDYKKQEMVGRFVVEARTLQASGDLHGALRKIEAGLSAYPNEIRLSQLYNTLRSAAAAERRKESAGPSVAPNPQPAEKSGLPPTVHTTFQPVPPSAAPAAKVEAQEVPGSRAAPSAPPAAAAQTSQSVSATAAQRISTPAVSKVPGRSRLLWGSCAAAIVLVAVVLAFRPGSKVVPPPAAQNSRIQLTANLHGVHFILDGATVSNPENLSVAPGSHKAEAALEGYTSDFKDFTVPKGGSKPLAVAFVLQPLLPELRVTSDLKAGRYAFDGAAPVDLQEGSLVRESIPSGPHTLTVLDGSRPVFTVAFTTKPKEAARLSAPLDAKLNSGLVITSLGSAAWVYGSPTLKGGVDGQPLESIPADGLPLHPGAGQDLRFVMDDGKNKPHTIPIAFSAVPVVSVFLSGGAERLPLTIKANVPDGTVSINGVALKKGLSNGTRTLLLGPGSYKVKVARDDYQDAPEQTINLKSGESSVKPLQFQLTEIPRMATLLLEGAPPGADVSIDGAREGTVGSNGTFTQQVRPGNHEIAVHRANYDSFKESRAFQVGSTLRLSAVMKAPGTVNFKVTPQNARISYRRDDDSVATEAANNHALDMRPGFYEIVAEADNFVSIKKALSVASGKVYDFSWSLQAKASTPATPIKRAPGEFFEDGAAWSLANGYWVHAGKGISFLRSPQSKLTLDFVNPKDSKDVLGIRMKRIAFVVDYSGPQDQVLYTLDAHNLSRKVIANGKPEKEFKVDSGMSGRTLRLTVDQDSKTITVRNASGKILDTIARKFVPGRIGLLDDLALAPFN